MTKTTEERRRDTANMRKCACGNTARFGADKCGRCEADDAEPKSFREFYEQRHGCWPGLPYQQQSEVFEQICDAVADYVDLKTR